MASLTCHEIWVRYKVSIILFIVFGIFTAVLGILPLLVRTSLMSTQGQQIYLTATSNATATVTISGNVTDDIYYYRWDAGTNDTGEVTIQILSGNITIYVGVGTNLPTPEKYGTMITDPNQPVTLDVCTPASYFMGVVDSSGLHTPTPYSFEVTRYVDLPNCAAQGYAMLIFWLALGAGDFIILIVAVGLLVQKKMKEHKATKYAQLDEMNSTPLKETQT